MKNTKRTTGLYCLLALSILLTSTMSSAEEPSAHKMPRVTVSEDLILPQKSVMVHGSEMTYLESGKGQTIVYIHGNPTFSYLWRNVIPHVSPNYHNIAVDLIGMGGSDKPEINYDFSDHYRYLSGFIDTLGAKEVVLVGHDWGAALAWEYARKNPTKVKALAFMEGVLPPAFPAPSFEAMGEEMGNMFRAFKDPVKGKEMVIDNNFFVEKVLPSMINRTLGETALEAYHAPYLDKQSRLPTLSWPREIPIGGEPQSSVALMNNISTFMGDTTMPVLLTYADPGVIIPRSAVSWYVEKIENLEVTYIGQGLHFIQEDQPDAIGLAIADWLRRNP